MSRSPKPYSSPSESHHWYPSPPESGRKGRKMGIKFSGIATINNFSVNENASTNGENINPEEVTVSTKFAEQIIDENTKWRLV